MIEIVPTAVFSVHKAEKMFTVEESTLLGNFPNAFGQIFPDACDIGFRMLSQNTGNVCDWVESKKEFSNEGELLVTIFEPTSTSGRRMPQLKGWTVHVLND